MAKKTKSSNTSPSEIKRIRLAMEIPSKPTKPKTTTSEQKPKK